MSEEATTPDLFALTAAAVRAFGRQDVDAAMGLFAGDAVVEATWMGTSFEGATAICGFLEDWTAAYEEHAVDIEEIVDFGHGIVLALVRAARPSGWIHRRRSRDGWLFQWVDGAISRLSLYLDRGDARSAAELLVDGALHDTELPVRWFFAAINRGDFAAAITAYADDVVLVINDSAVPTSAGTFTGHRAVGEWFHSFVGGCHLGIEEAFVADERVLVVARHDGRGRASGVAIEWPLAYAFTIKAGKIARLEVYRDRAEALADLGIEE